MLRAPSVAKSRDRAAVSCAGAVIGSRDGAIRVSASVAAHRASTRARHGSTYPALGLAGEAGEVAEHAKKAIRDDGGEVTDERRAAMTKELGDVLWYVAQLASELGLELEEIAQVQS